MFRKADGVGVSHFPRGNVTKVISGTRGWVGVHCLNDPYVYDVKGMILNVLFGVLVFVV